MLQVATGRPFRYRSEQVIELTAADSVRVFSQLLAEKAVRQIRRGKTPKRSTQSTRVRRHHRLLHPLDQHCVGPFQSIVQCLPLVGSQA